MSRTNLCLSKSIDFSVRPEVLSYCVRCLNEAYERRSGVKEKIYIISGENVLIICTIQQMYIYLRLQLCVTTGDDGT